jgi:pilus assembly protein CpaF
VNDPSRVFVARQGRHELTNLILTSAQVTELVERMLKSSGRRIDLSRPFVDAMLPEGHRLHVVLEGISRGFSAVNIAMKKSASVSYGTSRKASCDLRAHQPRSRRSRVGR